MLRCDAHFKVWASFVSAATAASGIFRVENKQPGKCLECCVTFQPNSEERVFPESPPSAAGGRGPAARKKTSKAPRLPRALGALHPFSPHQDFRIRSACCCSHPRRPAPLLTCTREARTKRKMVGNKCNLGLLLKLPMGVTGKRWSSSFWRLRTSVCEASQQLIERLNCFYLHILELLRHSNTNFLIHLYFLQLFKRTK